MATGSVVRSSEKRGGGTVKDGEGDLSLSELRGRVRCSHRGGLINGYPRISAYSVLSVPPDCGCKVLGIVSEQGETILPMQYGYLQIEGERLKLWMPGMKTAVWFDIEQVKNWRNNQPLKGVPAPP